MFIARPNEDKFTQFKYFIHSKTTIIYMSILHAKNPFKLHIVIFTKLCYTFIIIYYVTFIFMAYLLFR